MNFPDSNSWTIQSPIEQSIREKIDSIGIPLKKWNVSINRGILTGFNEAFIINTEIKNQLIADDPKSAEIIRPVLRGRDIKKYSVTFQDLWLIVTHNGNKKEGIKPVDVSEYPAIKKHLDQYYEKLSKRADKGDTPYNLRNCVYMDDFSKQKIVWGNLCLESQFAMASDDYFINAPSPMLVPGDYYLLAIMNSIVADWYIRQLGVTRNGGYFEYKPMFVEQLPIPQIDESLKDIYRSKAMEAEQNNTPEILDEINSMVFKLYNLSDEEIKYLKNQKCN